MYKLEAIETTSSELQPGSSNNSNRSFMVGEVNSLIITVHVDATNYYIYSQPDKSTAATLRATITHGLAATADNEYIIRLYGSNLLVGLLKISGGNYQIDVYYSSDGTTWANDNTGNIIGSGETCHLCDVFIVGSSRYSTVAYTDGADRKHTIYQNNTAKVTTTLDSVSSDLSYPCGCIVNSKYWFALYMDVGTLISGAGNGYLIYSYTDAATSIVQQDGLEPEDNYGANYNTLIYQGSRLHILNVYGRIYYDDYWVGWKLLSASLGNQLVIIWTDETQTTMKYIVNNSGVFYICSKNGGGFGRFNTTDDTYVLLGSVIGGADYLATTGGNYDYFTFGAVDSGLDMLANIEYADLIHYCDFTIFSTNPFSDSDYVVWYADDGATVMATCAYISDSGGNAEFTKSKFIHLTDAKNKLQLTYTGQTLETILKAGIDAFANHWWYSGTISLGTDTFSGEFKGTFEDLCKWISERSGKRVICLPTNQIVSEDGTTVGSTITDSDVLYGEPKVWENKYEVIGVELTGANGLVVRSYAASTSLTGYIKRDTYPKESNKTALQALADQMITNRATVGKVFKIRLKDKGLKRNGSIHTVTWTSEGFSADSMYQVRMRYIYENGNEFYEYVLNEAFFIEISNRKTKGRYSPPKIEQPQYVEVISDRVETLRSGTEQHECIDIYTDEDYKHPRNQIEQWGTSGEPTGATTVQPTTGLVQIVASKLSHDYPVELYDHSAVDNAEVYWDFTASADGYMTCYVCIDDTTKYHYLQLWDGTTQKTWMRFYNGEILWYGSTYTAFATYAVDTWYQIVQYFDASDDSVMIWINGVYYGKKTAKNSFTQISRFKIETGNADTDSYIWIDRVGLDVEAKYAFAQNGPLMAQSDYMEYLLVELIQTVKPHVFIAYQNSATAQSIPTGVSTLIAFDEEEYDPRGLFDNTATNYKFTAEVAGMYEFTVHIELEYSSNWGAGEQLRIEVYKNGSRHRVVFGKEIEASGTFYVSANGCIPMFLESGDYVQFYCYQNSGGAITLQNVDDYNYVGGKRVIG
jgi:hypothetical protein